MRPQRSVIGFKKGIERAFLFRRLIDLRMGPEKRDSGHSNFKPISLSRLLRDIPRRDR